MKAADRNFQGIWIPKMIYLNTEVNWYAKILFLEIHSFTENGKECYMSNKYIASFLNISKRQVSRYITELKTIGWIEEISFDGRKRYLRSALEFNFRTAYPNRQMCPGSMDSSVVAAMTIMSTIINQLQNKI